MVLTPERDLHLANFAATAKLRKPQRSDLDAFLLQIEAHPSIWRRASLLRFALRMCRHGGFEDERIRSRLRDMYLAAAQKGSLCTERLRYLLWARCPEAEAAAYEAERSVLYEIETAASPSDRLRLVAQSGLPFRIHGRDGVVSIRTSVGWRCIEAAIAEEPSEFNLLAGNIEGDICRMIGNWSVAGRTRLGKPPGGKNDDGLVVVRRGDDFLLAVGDGTGDSQFGYRASAIALAGLAEAYSIGASVELATECAAASVLADNLVWNLDGATTLAVCTIEPTHGVSVAAFGDPVVAIFEDTRLAYVSPFSPDVRQALGGEPLGDTITSSGRTVGRLDHVEAGMFVRWPCADGVVLGSDGLLLGHPSWGEIWADAAEGLTLAQRRVEKLVAGAERAIKAGQKADNLTALVALRAES